MAYGVTSVQCIQEHVTHIVQTQYRNTCFSQQQLNLKLAHIGKLLDIMLSYAYYFTWNQVNNIGTSKIKYSFVF